MKQTYLRKSIISLLCLVLAGHIHSQSENQNQTSSAVVSTNPPANANLRTMAEWEEIQALTITWADFPAILKQIVAAAVLETKVIIITGNPAQTLNYLTANNAGGPPISNTSNIEFIDSDYDSIWMRDYAANPVYTNEVDSLILVDWIYNRVRPADDSSPLLIADHLNLELYQTTTSPYNLMNTGGNFMSDGFGKAFASELVLEENDGNGPLNLTYPNHTESQIDNIMQQFMGIDTYIKMPTLPYDGIHHIDMHMKLLDEETLLVAEYPQGVADGPQIEANLDYVLSNYESKWGTPFKVVRIPSPPSVSGLYPDNNGAYRTYTNAVFVNNTIIIPTYREEYDSIAFKIWRREMPGYNIVGIDCDNQGQNIIAQSGAIHCITHSVGVLDPLLISHQPLEDTYNTINPYVVSAYINHRSGIAGANLYYKTSLQGSYTSIPMTIGTNNEWTAAIPAQGVGTTIYYYIEATANNGKTQTRPMPAPEGYWPFKVLGTVSMDEITVVNINRIYPNPASAITCIELTAAASRVVQVDLVDIAGRKVHEIYNGTLTAGTHKLFFNAAEFSSGSYFAVVKTATGNQTMPLMIR